MVLAKQRPDAHGRASLNEMKWNAAKRQTKKKKNLFVAVCERHTTLFAFWMQKFVCKVVFWSEPVCTCVCVRADWSLSGQHVWSCLLGGVTRTDTLFSSPHDSYDVNSKQAGDHLFFLREKTKILLFKHLSGSVKNVKTHHEKHLNVSGKHVISV